MVWGQVEMTDDDFASAYADPDITVRQIARQLGIRDSSVTHAARALGLPPRRKATDCKPIDPARFAELWREGLTVREMAANFNVSPRTVRANVSRMGLPKRGRA